MLSYEPDAILQQITCNATWWRQHKQDKSMKNKIMTIPNQNDTQ